MSLGDHALVGAQPAAHSLLVYRLREARRLPLEWYRFYRQRPPLVHALCGRQQMLREERVEDHDRLESVP